MDLNRIYKNFLTGKCSRDFLKNTLLQHAYKVVGWDKYIDPANFIIEYIPLIDSIIDNYKMEQCQFSHYITKRINWLKLDINKINIKKKEKENTYLSDINSYYEVEMISNELKPEYKITPEAVKYLKIVNGRISKKTTKRRFLIFVFKSSRLLTYDLVKLVSRLTGEPEEWIFQIKETLNSLSQRRIKRREYLELRKNRLFMEIKRGQIELNKVEDNRLKEELIDKINEKKARKKEIQKILDNRSYGPKNEEIARVLGIPKGTVDSSLFYMKKDLNALFPEMIID